MATQCGPASAHHHHHNFVSSNAYYGYVPPAQANPAPQVNGQHQDNGMDVDESYDDKKVAEQKMMVNGFGGRKRSFAGDELDNIPPAYMPRFKKFREEAVVTSVFSMVQETASGQKPVDWPRCTMSRHYYA